MRLLLPGRSGLPAGSPLDGDALAAVYAAPPGAWRRANMVSTLDGAAAGADGVTGSINTEADHVVFALLRRLSDALLVGAGTVRAEGYAAPRPEDGDPPVLCVVSNSGRVPPTVAGPQPGGGAVVLVTCEGAGREALSAARQALGSDGVLVCGGAEVDLDRAVAELAGLGLQRLLCEGGPALLGDLLRAGLVDELCLTLSPLVVGGRSGRIVTGGPLHVDLEPMTLVEQDGTVMGRWRVVPARP